MLFVRQLHCKSESFFRELAGIQKIVRFLLKKQKT